MAEPMRPAIRMDIITGASSLAMENAHHPADVAAQAAFDQQRARSASAMTPPMKKERMQTISRLALPISKNWSNTFCRWRQASGSATSVRQNRSTISPIF